MIVWWVVVMKGSYLMFEVLEVSFQTLQSALASSVHCLDDLIAAHDNYLSMIVDRALMERTVAPPPTAASASASASSASASSASPRLTLSQVNEVG